MPIILLAEGRTQPGGLQALEVQCLHASLPNLTPDPGLQAADLKHQLKEALAEKERRVLVPL